MAGCETRFGKLHIRAVDENGKPVYFGPSLKAFDREPQINNRRMVTPPEWWTWDLPAGRWHVALSARIGPPGT